MIPVNYFFTFSKCLIQGRKAFLCISGFFILNGLLCSQNHSEFENYYSKGEEFLFQNYDSCNVYLSKLKSIKDLNDVQKVKTNLLAAMANRQLWSVDRIRSSLNKSLTILRKQPVQQKELETEVLILLGSVNAANSNIDQGIPQLVEAMSILEKSDNKNLIDYCQLQIAEAHRVKKQFKTGYNILNRIITNDQISEYNRAYAYNRLAPFFYEWSRRNFPFKSPIDSIIKYSNLCLEIAERNKYKVLMSSSYNELGLQYYYKEDLKRSLFYYSSSIKIFKELRWDVDIVNTSNNIMQIHLKKGDYKKALVFGKRSLNQRKGGEYPQIFRKTYHFIAKAYQGLGMYQEALSAMEKVYDIEKMLFERYTDKTVTELITKYNYKLKEAETEQEKHLRLAEKRKNNFNTAILISVLVIVFTLLFVSLVVSKLRKKVFKQKQDLLKKRNEILHTNFIYNNKRLTVEALRMIQYDQLLQETTEKLSAVAYLKKTEIKEHIQKMIHEIRIAKKNEVWEDFEKSFKEVHVDFYKNLTLDFHNLSSKELRLCAFLKLNLSSKEISVINGTSLRSVESARHRLRKKMEIEESIDLNSFFQRY